MPYDEAAWKRRSLAHYIAVAQIDVPRARETALQLAAAAEAASAGGLAGLTDAVRAATEPPRPERPQPTTNRRT